ncbi:MAG TPA: SOS response-associated peptidase [Leadbetterella sp.]|nr:SOS response-associated peptidase [Leadbetterella sp.]
MCYHVATVTDPDVLARKMNKERRRRLKASQFKIRYDVNGFDNPLVPVIPAGDPDFLHFFRWRLIPGHVTDVKAFKANTLNARSEEIFEKSSYRNCWQNRCLVVVDGFYEPHVTDVKKPSESYFIRNFEDEPLTLGGIYSIYEGKGTFAILTTEANEQMAEVHNEGKRMPVILDGRNREEWLRPDLTQEEMLAMCKPYDWPLLAFRTIDGVFNNRVNTDVPEAILPMAC